MYVVLRGHAGAHGGDGHADEVAELAGMSAERRWCEEEGGGGLRVQVGESFPMVRDTPACGRGDAGVVWGSCLPGARVDVFLAWFGRQSTDRVTGSVTTCCSP